MSEELVFKRAITISKYADASTLPNPKVGAVIVHNNKIISEGFHKKAGEEHAEVIAINKIKTDKVLQEAKLFVTLEPCNFFGKTPACTNLIINKKIPEVFILTKDPNPKVAGNGIKQLINNNVKVNLFENSELAIHYKFINRHFWKNQKTNKCYITLKFAQTPTNVIGSKSKRIQISNFASQVLVHKLRSEHHAILVGANTYKIDKPKLNVRLAPATHNPVKIILDFESSFSPENFEKFSEGKYIVLNNKYSSQQKNVNFIIPKIKKYSNNTWDLEELSYFLYSELKISSVLVEGGAKVINSFLSQNIADEIVRITANKDIIIPEDFVKIDAIISHRNYRLFSTENLFEDTIHTFIRSDIEEIIY